jgi:hypothetical protein
MSISTTTVRSGSRSLRANPAAATDTRVTRSGLSGTMWVARVYVNFTTLPDADAGLLMSNLASAGVGFKLSDSSIGPVHYVGSTLTFSGSRIAVTTGQWYRIDLKVNVVANPHRIDVSVNGVACTQGSNAVAASAHSGVDLGVHRASGTVSADAFFDDYIDSLTSGDFPLGAGYVNHFVPTSDRTHNIAGASDFEIGTTGTDITNATTTAYQLIDDVPLPATTDTGANDYINMIAPPNVTDYTRHRFGPAPGISTPTTGPRSVECIIGIHQAGTGTGNMYVRARGGGGSDVIVHQAVGVAGTTTIIYKRALIDMGAPWTVSGGGDDDFTVLDILFGSITAVDANPDQYLDAAMIEAEFVEVAAFANPEVLGRPYGASGQRQMSQLQAT